MAPLTAPALRRLKAGTAQSTKAARSVAATALAPTIVVRVAQLHPPSSIHTCALQPCLLTSCWGAQQMQEIEESTTQIHTTPEWKALEDHVTEIERT